MPPPNISSDRKPLYTDGVLEGLAREAGLIPVSESEIDCVWNFKDKNDALRTMLSAGLISLVIQKIGEQKVREIAGTVIENFKQPDGSYQIKNTFKCLVSTV